MYLSATTEKIQVVLSGAITTNQLQCVASYQDVTSAGMTLPMLSNQANTNSTTDVDLVGVPGASTTRQIVHINIYNADSVAATVIVKKDISGTEYILTKALVQSGDTLQWSRESGWTILKQSEQESVILTEFTASGTWTKPAGLKRIIGFCVGAGGGAGSGRQGIAGENRFGGGGGGGGAAVWRMVAASDLTATVAVTIGTGGTGGAAQASTSTNGVAGTAGTDTTFGALITAKGGSGGGGGSTAAGTAGAGGVVISCVPAYMPFSVQGGNGAAGATTTTAAGTAGFIQTGAPGGGGGGGVASTNTNGTAANTGGGVYEAGSLQAGPVSGASPNGVNDVCTILFPSTTLTSTAGIGTAGAGNNPATVTGGNGGRCAGGGGGSGTLNGTSSGKGGDGGNGLCIVMEIF